MTKFLCIVAAVVVGKYVVLDNLSYEKRQAWTQTQHSVCLDVAGHNCMTVSHLNEDKT